MTVESRKLLEVEGFCKTVGELREFVRQLDQSCVADDTTLGWMPGDGNTPAMYVRASTWCEPLAKDEPDTVR